MTRNSDWLASRKNERLEMSRLWCIILAEKAGLWSVPESVTTAFNEAMNDAASEFAVPVPERNTVTNARLKDAFKKLTTIMRDVKKRYFFVPPLTNSDIAALGLKPKDNTPTTVLVPTGTAEVRITYPGRIQLMVHLKPAEGTQIEQLAYYGCRIYYGIYDAGATLPAYGPDLRESLFTRRKKELFTFQPEDAGKTACFCLRYENSKGKAGPWGPLNSAIIP